MAGVRLINYHDSTRCVTECGEGDINRNLILSLVAFLAEVPDIHALATEVNEISLTV